MPHTEASFTFLRDCAPQWLQDITRIQDKVLAMRLEVTKASAACRPRVRRKPSSAESIRLYTEDDPPQPGEVKADSSQSLGRTSSSALSARVSATPRSRFVKPMVAIAYDGDTQKLLELLVRAIGTGRNMLRKAKMETKMQALAALADDCSDGDGDTDAQHLEEEAMLSKISYRPRMSSMPTRVLARSGQSTSTPEKVLDETDRLLEDAQSRCEKAAHLILRDGDCSKELESVCRSLQVVLETAKTEVMNAGPREVPQSTRADSSSIVEPSRYAVPETSQKLDPGRQKYPATTSSDRGPLAPKVNDIEVDDDEDDELDDFVMPPVRLTSRLMARAR